MTDKSAPDAPHTDACTEPGCMRGHTIRASAAPPVGADAELAEAKATLQYAVKKRLALSEENARLAKAIREVRGDMTPRTLKYEAHYLRQYIEAWARKLDDALAGQQPAQSEVCKRCAGTGYAPGCDADSRWPVSSGLRHAAALLVEFAAPLTPFDPETPSCGKCHVAMALDDGAEWPEEGESVVCNRCAQELAELVFVAIRALAEKHSLGPDRTPCDGLGGLPEFPCPKCGVVGPHSVGPREES